MSQTHIHLILNHFPIVGSLIGTLLLLWGLISKNIQLQKAASIVLVIMSVLAIPVFLTGEAAEETVENIAGVSEALIESHEDSAKISIWFMVASGITGLFALFMYWRKNLIYKHLFAATFFVSILAFGTIAWTGYTGGQIRHTELGTATTGGGTDAMEKAGDDMMKGVTMKPVLLWD
ncbi:MAG: hypothetical protein EOO01_40005 [Chitinophagaceae bacterium]|nr:MAG: hypothetical protein EOO01_40005 [Chitinophagaceae bacterium]